MLGPDGVRGMRVLDLYAGTGAFGIEALSRGAASAEFVERDERRCQEVRHSLSRLGYQGRGKVHRGDALKVVERLEGEFNLVFADPPYGEDPFRELAQGLTKGGLVAGDATLYLEHSRKLELPRTLPGVVLETTRKYGDAAVSVYRRASQAQE